MLICPDCFQDKQLQSCIKEIRPKFHRGQCDFHSSKKGVPVAEVADLVQPVIEGRYHHSSIGYDGEPTGIGLEEIIYDLTGAENDGVVKEIVNELINSEAYVHDNYDYFFSEIAGYDEIETIYDEGRSQSWELFQREIIHSQRFFSQSAQEKLAKLFDGFHLLKDDQSQRAIRELTENSELIFRARHANTLKAQTKIRDNVAEEMGAPPEKLRQAGRMNPSGIAAFYGAFDLDTCLAELRPSPGDTVMIAKFRPTRPLLVLDTTAFSRPQKPHNIFQRKHTDRMMLWSFMRQFMVEIARPCLEEDTHIDYIPTQVVAEYLVNLHKFKLKKSEPSRSIDGIIFKSAQSEGGRNIVLFGDACEVQSSAKIDSSLASLPRKKKTPGLAVVEDSLRMRTIEGVKVISRSMGWGQQIDQYN